MAGGWGHIVDGEGRFYGAGTIEHGGDAEELAEDLFGMLWWLAGQCAALQDGSPQDQRRDALLWIRQAEDRAKDGFKLGGLSAGDEPGDWE